MPKIRELNLSYDQKGGELVRNDDFFVLRDALFEKASAENAHEVAYCLLYQQTTYRGWWQREDDLRRLTAAEYEELIECDDFLLWQTLRRSAHYEDYNEAALALIAKLALADLPAFHEAVGNWGTQIHFHAALELFRAQEAAAKLGQRPSFANYVSKLRPVIQSRLETEIRNRVLILTQRKKLKLHNRLPEFSDLVAQHVLDEMELEGYTLEPLSTHRQLFEDYAKYCYGFNGDPKWMGSGGDRKLLEQDYIHVFRITYEGTVLFWLYCTPTFERCRWDERVVTDETRSLKRSLGGKINMLRRDTRIVQEIE